MRHPFEVVETLIPLPSHGCGKGKEREARLCQDLNCIKHDLLAGAQLFLYQSDFFVSKHSWIIASPVFKG